MLNLVWRKKSFNVEIRGPIEKEKKETVAKGKKKGGYAHTHAEKKVVDRHERSGWGRKKGMRGLQRKRKNRNARSRLKTKGITCHLKTERKGYQPSSSPEVKRGKRR